MAESLSLISAVTALVSVIVGPLVTVLTVRNQIRAQTVSQKRQIWINTKRDEISKFVQELSVASSRMIAMKFSEEQAYAIWRDATKALTLGIANISLLLNPQECDHAKLIE